MRLRQLKIRVTEVLAEGRMGLFASLVASHPSHGLVAALFSCLCHPSATVRSNAVAGFGILVSRMADDDLEAARVVMRRFLWALNEESGGIGWGVPEAMARILGASPVLRHEYLHLFCSYLRGDGPELFQDGNYLELPMLQRGLLLGVGDLCRDLPVEMREQGIADDLLGYLLSNDHQVIGLAIRCLGFLGLPESRERITTFLAHPGRVDLWEAGRMRAVTVGELAAESLLRIATDDSPKSASCKGTT